MLLAQSLSGSQLALLGLAVIVLGLTLRRGMLRARRIEERDPLREVKQEFQVTEQRPEAMLGRMEIRVHEYAREVEARIQARLAVLDQLIQDADRRIADLQQTLDLLDAEERGLPVRAGSPGPDLLQYARLPGASESLPLTNPTTGDVRLVRRLAAAGLTAQQIAQRLDLSQETIRKLLNTPERERPEDDSHADAA